MSKQIKIEVYTTSDQTVPAARRAYAHFINPCGLLSPLRFTGPDEDSVRQKAQEFWDTEMAKLAEKKPDGRTKEGRAILAAQKAQAEQQAAG